MEKNWLIRTIQKQILGPVSKEKVIEFVEKGSLKGEDQVCSGNGFWFRIDEEEFVEKYLFGNEIQSFNPVSEAQTCVAGTEDAGQTAQTQMIDLNALKLEDEAVLPQKSELEYPDEKNDPSKVAPKNIKYPSSDDLAYPEEQASHRSGSSEFELPEDDEDISIEIDTKK